MPLDLPRVQQALDAPWRRRSARRCPLRGPASTWRLHDLCGQAQRAILVPDVGPAAGRPVRLSWTVNVPSLDDLGGEIENGRKRGYRNFNIKMRRRSEIRRGTGPAGPPVGAGGFPVGRRQLRLRHRDGAAVAPRLAEAGVDVLESPLPANQIRGYQALHRQGAVPIVMDEGVVSPVDVEEFIRLGMLDGLAIKISRAGGLESSRQQIRRVLDAGLFWLGSGLTDPDLSLAASLALFAAYGLEKPAALNGPQFLRDSILTEPLVIRGDLADVPRGPGLGVEVDEDKIARAVGPGGNAGHNGGHGIIVLNLAVSNMHCFPPLSTRSPTMPHKPVSARITRRTFIAGSSAAGAAVLAAPHLVSAASKGANERLSIALIGVGGRGSDHLHDLVSLSKQNNVEITAVCNVWNVNLATAAARVKAASGKQPRTATRFGDILALPDVDGVVIATPDFAHGPILVAALEAGKDVYVEKPMSIDLELANKALDLARAGGRVVQAGTQRRSDGQHIAAAKLVATGILGRISRVTAEVAFNEPRWARGYGDCKQADVDWDAYLFNRPQTPFDPRLLRRWHLYKLCTNGLSGLWMSHYADAVHMIVGTKYPASAVAHGGTYVWKDGREHADTFRALLDYPNGFLMSWGMGLGNAAGGQFTVHGTQGTLDLENLGPFAGRRRAGDQGQAAEDRARKEHLPHGQLAAVHALAAAPQRRHPVRPSARRGHDHGRCGL